MRVRGAGHWIGTSCASGTRSPKSGVSTITSLPKRRWHSTKLPWMDGMPPSALIATVLGQLKSSLRNSQRRECPRRGSGRSPRAAPGRAGSRVRWRRRTLSVASIRKSRRGSRDEENFAGIGQQHQLAAPRLGDLRRFDVLFERVERGVQDKLQSTLRFIVQPFEELSIFGQCDRGGGDEQRTIETVLQAFAHVVSDTALVEAFQIGDGGGGGRVGAALQMLPRPITRFVLAIALQFFLAFLLAAVPSWSRRL